MTGLIRRLGWYLIGFSLGIVFLVFFLKKKSGGEGVEFCYLPNCRVLKDIRSKPLTLSDYHKDSIIIKTILKDGNVNFSKSNTETTNCKTYWVDFEKNSLEIENCKDSAKVLSLIRN